MNQLSISKIGRVIECLMDRMSLRAAAESAGVSNATVFKSVVPRVGHGAGVLDDLLFENTPEAANYNVGAWVRTGRRQLKTDTTAYALIAIEHLYNLVSVETDGRSAAMRLGVLDVVWTPEHFARLSIEAAAWAPPRWPSEATAKEVASPIVELYGQKVTLKHVAELAGISKMCVWKRIRRGQTPEQIIQRRATRLTADGGDR